MNPLPKFAGSPQRYRILSVAISVLIHGYLYGGMVVLVHVVHGRDWILGRTAIAVALVSAALYARVSYVWMMRLDAQYGRGSAWRLTPRCVSLPEYVVRVERSGDPTAVRNGCSSGASS